MGRLPNRVLALLPALAVVFVTVEVALLMSHHKLIGHLERPLCVGVVIGSATYFLFRWVLDQDG